MKKLILATAITCSSLFLFGQESTIANKMVETFKKVIESENIKNCTINNSVGVTLQHKQKFEFLDNFIVVKTVNRKGVEKQKYYNVYRVAIFYTDDETIYFSL